MLSNSKNLSLYDIDYQNFILFPTLKIKKIKYLNIQFNKFD
jgi:hypothetical protein